MAPSGPDASNSCLPPSSPVVVSVPPLPSPTRGDRCMLEGQVGRINNGKAMLIYPSGKLVIARNLDGQSILATSVSACQLPVMTYRGHHHAVTALKMSPSGAYMASADERGMLRVWAFDHEEHLCKYDQAALTGPIRDLSWDGDSQRLALAGERADARSECARVLQWDTGVTVGQLAQHLKGRVSSIAFKSTRPYRIATAGKDDSTLHFHKGPPFERIPPVQGVPAETIHSKSVQCVRFNSTGSLLVSVSSDRSIAVYDGKTMECKSKLEQAHAATIYSVAWSGDDSMILTASGDGTCKLFTVNATDGTLTEKHLWNPAQAQYGRPFEKVPVGGTQLGCTFVKGDMPVSVGLNGQLSLLPRPGSSDSIQVLTGHNVPIAGLAVDAARGVLYTGDTDGHLCQWLVATGQPVARLTHPEGNEDLMYTVHGGAISGLAVASGKVLSVGWDDKMFVTDSTTGQVQADPVSLGAQPSALAAGKELAVIITVQGLLLVKKGQLISGQMIPLTYQALSVCVSADDQTVYVGGSDAKIHVYSVSGGDTLQEKHVVENVHLQPVHALALSHDGTKLASADVKDICVLDLTKNYAPVVGRGRWCFHVQRITCLSWSWDDQVIASGGADDSLYLWHVEKKMKRVHYPYAHRGGLTAVHFVSDGPSSSPSGWKLVTAGNDAVVQLWDVAKDVQDKFA